MIGWINGVPCDQYYIRAVGCIVMLGWSLVIIILLGSLVSLHIYLIVLQKTTSEFFRERKLRQKSEEPSKQESNEHKNDDSTPLLLQDLQASLSQYALKMLQVTSTGLRTLSQRVYQSSSKFTSTSTATTTIYERKTYCQLLPMWQYESAEDIFQQDDLTDIVVEKYRQLCIQSAADNNNFLFSSSSESNTPATPPENLTPMRQAMYTNNNIRAASFEAIV